MIELFGFGWVIAPPIVYGIVLRRKYLRFRSRPDARNRRDFIAAVAFFVAALAASLSILVVLVPADVAVRRFCAGIAWATFSAAGIVWLQEIRQENHHE